MFSQSNKEEESTEQFFMNSYLCCDHVTTFDLTMFLPHERRAHEILRLNVNKMLRATDLVNVGRMDTAIDQTTFLQVQIAAACKTTHGGSLESFRKFGVLFLNWCPVYQSLTDKLIKLLKRCVRDAWIEFIDP
jgi:hypothetical protein